MPDGELQNIARPDSKPPVRLGLLSTSAEDLAVLGEACAPSTDKDKQEKMRSEVAADHRARSEPLGFAIVGMGRAGKIHLEVLQRVSADSSVRWLVDTSPEWSIANCPGGTKVTTDITDALRDACVDCVIVSTPTPWHASVIRLALEAGKHVFAEKPLCCDAAEVRELFALAERSGRLLHTAYNRRSDPLIEAALAELRSNVKGKPLGATLVSRDFPYPLPSYLKVSGNIFKDCVVHDLDYLTWLLDDAVVALRATASTGDDPEAVVRACGMWEYSEVHLTLQSGATCTLVNGRVSTSYEHRLDIYCEHGVVRVPNPHEGTEGVAFSDRFAASYHKQLAAFRCGVRAVAAGAAPAPNVDLARTLLLEELVLACERSVAEGGATVELPAAAAAAARGPQSGSSSPRSIEAPQGSPPPPPKLDAYPVAAAEMAMPSNVKTLAPAAGKKVAAEDASEVATEEATEEAAEEAADAKVGFRTYDDQTAARVKEAYRKMRERQSVEHVRKCLAKYCAPGSLGTVRMSVWEALSHLDTFVDLSDPDISLPNSVHAFQTAEGLRAARMPDWMQLTGLIHDLGKMVYLRGCDADGTSMAEQWSIVGDTWVVGCAMPEQMIYPEFNGRSPDAAHAARRTATGIYEPGCGLDHTLVAFGHDEYFYQVLAQTAGVRLPKEALYVVRYHSLYPWHEQECYAALESEHDRCMKGWVKLFNQHDLYTKRDTRYTADELEEMRRYYTTLIDKYLPAQLDF